VIDLHRRRQVLSGGGAVAVLVVLAWFVWQGPTPLPVMTAGPAAALAEEGPPHSTALQNADGSWKYTNALVGETSPYLLLHAHNPVDWYPWGPEALERARAEDRPIFLSVGYSTCYWCHVMEREVFSNEQIARVMNQWFVNIKVDREERPDLDGIYMTATQLLTGGGGWPNSVFMTPTLKPFFAGTYFPPVSKYGRPGFPEVLAALHEAWEERRQEVEQQAEQLTERVRRSQEAQGASGDPGALTRGLIDGAIKRLQGRFDEGYGGFGKAPKFPPDMDLELLMAQYGRSGDENLLRLVRHTLEQMARGGIRDHLGGGFHRYATDHRWRIPHFEKMLYNQAALARAYLHAYELTGSDELRQAAQDIFAFTDRVMRLPGGGFYSALDSETGGIEGLSYLWTKPEIRQILGADAGVFFSVYDLAPMPEGDRGVLFMPRSLADVAAEQGVEPSALNDRLAPLRQQLLAIRQQRPAPLLDTKILSGWNGMMIDAYAYGYEILGHEQYLHTARQAAAFVWQRLRDGEGRLQRSYRDGRVGHDAFQQDYAYLARGLLGLYRATGEQGYRRQAEELAATMDRTFWDEQDGGFFVTDRSEALIAQSKNPHDGAMASGNSVAAHVLIELARITGREAYRTKARGTLQAFAGAMTRSPGGFSHMLLAVHRDLPDLLSGLAPKGATTSRMLGSDEYVATAAFVSVDRLTAGAPFQVTARLAVADGWHINANPASYDFLIPTTLRVPSGLPVEAVAVEYPQAHMFTPAFYDDSISVYTDTAIVQARLQLKDGAPSMSSDRLSVTLRFQACNDVQCLAASEVTMPVAIEAALFGE